MTDDERREGNERRIVQVLLEDARDQRLGIWVCDGETWVWKTPPGALVNVEDILDVMFTTGGDTVRLTGPNGHVGSICLVYGNDLGENVIADSRDTPEMTGLLARAELLAEDLARTGGEGD